MRTSARTRGGAHLEHLECRNGCNKKVLQYCIGCLDSLVGSLLSLEEHLVVETPYEVPAPVPILSDLQYLTVSPHTLMAIFLFVARSHPPTVDGGRCCVEG
jgi:hypothetical protein